MMTETTKQADFSEYRKLRAQVIELFGTDTLPTPWGASVRHEETRLVVVGAITAANLERLRALNPGLLVVAKEVR